jgi:hypothetical protein
MLVFKLVTVKALHVRCAMIVSDQAVDRDTRCL